MATPTDYLGAARDRPVKRSGPTYEGPVCVFMQYLCVVGGITDYEVKAIGGIK